jgi:hypothetical protein
MRPSLSWRAILQAGYISTYIFTKKTFFNDTGGMRATVAAGSPACGYYKCLVPEDKIN